MTLEGGKDGGSAPAADPNIGIAQRELSKLATEQWEEFKTTIYPDLKASAATQEARVQGQYETTKKYLSSSMNKVEKLTTDIKKAQFQPWKNFALMQINTTPRLIKNS
jgi:hypothetical protein